MVRTAIIPLLIIAGLRSHAQAPASMEQVPRFWLGAQASPDHAYRTLTIAETNAATEVVHDARERLEVPRLGFTAAIFAGTRLTEHIGLEAGLGYALRGWAWDLSALSFGDAVDPRRGFIYATNESLRSVRMDLHFLIVPLRATFTLGAGRLQWITGLGASADFLLKAQYVNVWSDRVTHGDPGDASRFNLTPSISTGAQRAIGRTGWLRLEPTFRYGVLPLNDGPIEARTWSAGLQAGYTRWF